jgi:hypothetical protein
MPVGIVLFFKKYNMLYCLHYAYIKLPELDLYVSTGKYFWIMTTLHLTVI